MPAGVTAIVAAKLRVAYPANVRSPVALNRPSSRDRLVIAPEASIRFASDRAVRRVMSRRSPDRDASRSTVTGGRLVTNVTFRNWISRTDAIVTPDEFGSDGRPWVADPNGSGQTMRPSSRIADA